MEGKKVIKSRKLEIYVVQQIVQIVAIIRWKKVERLEGETVKIYIAYPCTFAPLSFEIFYASIFLY